MNFLIVFVSKRRSSIICIIFPAYISNYQTPATGWQQDHVGCSHPVAEYCPGRDRVFVSHEIVERRLETRPEPNVTIIRVVSAPRGYFQTLCIDR